MLHHRPPCNIPHTPRGHARHRRILGGEGGCSRPIRSRTANSLVKSRFAPPISLEFSQRPASGPRSSPVSALSYGRYLSVPLKEDRSLSVLFFLSFLFLPGRSSVRRLRRVILTARNPRCFCRRSQRKFALRGLLYNGAWY